MSSPVHYALRISFAHYPLWGNGEWRVQFDETIRVDLDPQISHVQIQEIDLLLILEDHDIKNGTSGEVIPVPKQSTRKY